MSLIDPRAIIDPSAKLAADVQVGPWSIIGPDVEIGEGTVVGPHVVLKGPTVIGKHNKIYQFSSVGEDTPDLKYKGEPTRLVIGDHNVIREGVTIHRGTVQDRSETTIGSHNLLMAYVHVGLAPSSPRREEIAELGTALGELWFRATPFRDRPAIAGEETS